MPSLNESFEYLQKLPFPDHPDSDALAEWIVDLAEADAYFAGVAQSVLGGANPRAFHLAGTDRLRAALKNIRVGSAADQAIFSQCERYLEALECVREALLASGSHPRPLL